MIKPGYRKPRNMDKYDGMTAKELSAYFKKENRKSIIICILSIIVSIASIIITYSR